MQDPTKAPPRPGGSPETGSLPCRKAKTIFSKRAKEAWILTIPALFMLFGVAGWPLLRTFFYSLTDAALDTPEDYSLVGLTNYLGWVDGEAIGVLADPLWWRSVVNTLSFAAVSVTCELILGMVVALLMHQSLRGRGLIRTAVLIPWAIPTIVSAKMWGWMFHDQYGVVNDILSRLGLIDHPVAWIAEPFLSMCAVVIADVWKTTPFMALLLLAALQTIPTSLYEAARVDGASAWTRFWHITLPLIRPAMIVALIFRAMDALRVFDLIYVLTSNSEATISVSGYARDQLVGYQKMGTGSAASVLVFLMVTMVAACFLYFNRIAAGSGEK